MLEMVGNAMEMWWKRMDVIEMDGNEMKMIEKYENVGTKYNNSIEIVKVKWI